MHVAAFVDTTPPATVMPLPAVIAVDVSATHANAVPFHDRYVPAAHVGAFTDTVEPDVVIPLPPVSDVMPASAAHTHAVPVHREY